jgi:hypothetical protein
MKQGENSLGRSNQHRSFKKLVESRVIPNLLSSKYQLTKEPSILDLRMNTSCRRNVSNVMVRESWYEGTLDRVNLCADLQHEAPLEIVIVGLYEFMFGS